MCNKYKGNYIARMITRFILEGILVVSFLCSLVRLSYLVLLVPILYGGLIILEMKYHKEIEQSKRNLQQFKDSDKMGNPHSGYQIM